MSEIEERKLKKLKKFVPEFHEWGLSRELANWEKEKEEFYDNPPKMNSFKEASARVLVRNGSFYKPELDRETFGGDDRGNPDWGTDEHFKKCGVAGFNSFDENSSWTTYDSFTSDTNYGVEDETFCNCKKHYRTRVYLENMDFSAVLKELIMED